MNVIGTLIASLLIMTSDPQTAATLVPGAKPLAEPGRYESSRSYDDTVDFYRRVFQRTGGVRWYNIVNQPTVKAKHVASLRSKTKWQGINIYERQGKVRIFIVPRTPAK